MAEKTEAARVIAKLLANRRTPLNEISHLIENVERALSALDGAPVERKRPQASAKSAPPIVVAVAADPPRAKRSVVPREPRVAAPPPPASPEPAEIKPVQPTLLRRAEVIHVAPVAPPPQPVAAATAAPVRGVVQWFDTRTSRGTLRLQGLSSDLPVDGDALAASGLTRLFKGQEIEATLDGSEETPKIAALRLLNLAPNSPVMSGMVRDRHAKQVVVELKREALSRAAARAEAELLLPSRRAR
jgi:cold shock CspA family protein